MTQSEEKGITGYVDPVAIEQAPSEPRDSGAAPSDGAGPGGDVAES